jgi:hypothetical protein
MTPRPGQHVVVTGSTNYQYDEEPECRDDAGADGEALRCCADTVPAPPHIDV